MISSVAFVWVLVREKPTEPTLVLLWAVLVFQGARFVYHGNRPAAEILGSHVSIWKIQSGRRAEFLVQDIQKIVKLGDSSIQIVVSGKPHKVKGGGFAPGELERFYYDLLQLHDT